MEPRLVKMTAGGDDFGARMSWRHTPCFPDQAGGTTEGEPLMSTDKTEFIRVYPCYPWLRIRTPFPRSSRRNHGRGTTDGTDEHE